MILMNNNEQYFSLMTDSIYVASDAFRPKYSSKRCYAHKTSLMKQS